MADLRTIDRDHTAVLIMDYQNDIVNAIAAHQPQLLERAAAVLSGARLAGVPVIYVYIALAHNRNPLPLDPVTNRPTPDQAFGPGEAEYVAQLKAYDVAFGKFFARLATDGITKDNTLFTVVPDENDHFVGGAPSPANCDGINVPCTYAQIGEIDALLNRLLITQRANSTTFSVHNDDAPTIYVNGNPAPTDAVTRTMEHDLDALVATNPITGNTDKLSQRLADQAEMKLLHMVTASPARTPTLTMFGNENYFFENGSGGACADTVMLGWRSRIWKIRAPEAVARWAAPSMYPSVRIGEIRISR